MGLDQFLYKSKRGIVEKTLNEWYELYPNDWVKPETEEEGNVLCQSILDTHEIADWRKHSNLQGYIQNLFDYDINLKYVELSKSNLLDILEKSKNKSMSKSSGFFWGETRDKDYEYTVKVMEEALEAVEEGYKIYYFCWY